MRKRVYVVRGITVFGKKEEDYTTWIDKLISLNSNKIPVNFYFIPQHNYRKLGL